MEFLHAAEDAVTSIARLEVWESNAHYRLIVNTEKANPRADREYLAELEGVGVPTIRAMILGDPYLRYLKSDVSMAYAAAVGRELERIITESKPELILASNDRLLASMALAVSKKLNIPFVAMAFTVIPDHRTWFINAMTPNSLMPRYSARGEQVADGEVRAVYQAFLDRANKVVAYRAPASITDAIIDMLKLGRAKINNHLNREKLGINRYNTLSFVTAMKGRLRRFFNRLSLVNADLITSPPAGKFAYFPLHMSPESMIDTWAAHYQNQIETLRTLSLSLPIDVKLVAKLHFSDPDNYSRAELRRLLDVPEVCVAHPNANSREFLEKASLVVGITGTTNIEAALLGKPTLIYGDSPYVEFPNSRRAVMPDQLYEQIEQMLVLQHPGEAEILKSLKAFMERYADGRNNDWNIAVDEGDVDKYTQCFEELALVISEMSDRDNNLQTKASG